MLNYERLNCAFDILEYEDELEIAILRHQAESDQLRADCWELKDHVKELKQKVQDQDKLISRIFKELSETNKVSYA